MPATMSSMGIMLGCFTIVIAGLASGLGLYLLSRCALRIQRGRSSFFAVAKRTFPQVAVVFDAAIAIKCFGVGVSYLIIIGDLTPPIMMAFFPGAERYAFLVNRNFWITLFMLVIVPLSFLRRLDSLKYTSVIALFAVGYLVLTVITHFFLGDTVDQRGVVRLWTWVGPGRFISSLPVITFGFTCHQNIFSIANEIADEKQLTKVIATSIGCAMGLYLVVATLGYLSFGDNVGANIIAQYHTSLWTTVGQSAIVVLVLFSYPLQCHPCRLSISHIVSSCIPSSFLRSSAPTNAAAFQTTSSSPMSDLKFSSLTVLILILSYITAMSVSSLERVLAFVGSTGSTAISFILPGLFYYSMTRPGGLPPRQHNQIVKYDDDDETASITSDYSASINEADLSTSTVGGTISHADGSVESARAWRRRMRRLAAAGLAIYGVAFMIM